MKYQLKQNETWMKYTKIDTENLSAELNSCIKPLKKFSYPADKVFQRNYNS